MLYYLHYFTLYLLSMVVILAWLFTPWFIEQGCRVGSLLSSGILRGNFDFIVTNTLFSYCVCNGETLFWTVVLSRVCAQCVMITFLPPAFLASLLQGIKINDAYNTCRYLDDGNFAPTWCFVNGRLQSY